MFLKIVGSVITTHWHTDCLNIAVTTELEQQIFSMQMIRNLLILVSRIAEVMDPT